MTLTAILLPVFALIILTFFLGLRMAWERTAAIKAGLVPDEARLYPVKWPGKAQQVTNSFHNQLEMPILFYVLVILAIISHKADLLFVVMSWCFVLLRFIHAGLHITTNVMAQRGAAFGLGVLILLVMWAIFAVRIIAL